MLTAILLLSSRYSRTAFRVLWLIFFGSFRLSSATLTALHSICLRVASTIRTVLRVGECLTLDLVDPGSFRAGDWYILVTNCYLFINFCGMCVEDANIY